MKDNFFATRIGLRSGTLPTVRTTQNLAEDLAWYENYVADRRARNIPVGGVEMPGEARAHTRDGVDYCRNGHALIAGSFVWREIRGYQVRECLECRQEGQRRRDAERRGGTVAAKHGHATDTHCANGHEWTEETIVIRNGTRRCHTCILEQGRRYHASVKPQYRDEGCCINGHLQTPITRGIRSNGTEFCRVCSRESSRRHYMKSHPDAYTIMPRRAAAV